MPRLGEVAHDLAGTADRNRIARVHQVGVRAVGAQDLQLDPAAVPLALWVPKTYANR